jgi:hypothetical protein
MFRSRFLLVLLLPLLLLTMAFRQSPLVDPAPVAVPAGLTEVQVGKAVKAALLGRGWTVTDEQSASVSAQLSREDWIARIRVDFDAKQVQIRYVDSKNLKYEVKRDGTRLIHTNYMNWMKFLHDDIGRDLELLSATSG